MLVQRRTLSFLDSTVEKMSMVVDLVVGLRGSLLENVALSLQTLGQTELSRMWSATAFPLSHQIDSESVKPHCQACTVMVW